MTEAFSTLSDADIRELVAALKSRRVSAPYSELQVNRVLAPQFGSAVTTSLQELSTLGFDEQQIATTLEMILHDRSDGRQNEPPIDLVTSGPEAPGIANRDTSVVVRELFAHAKKSVLVVGYAVYQGQSVFEELGQAVWRHFLRPSRSSTRTLPSRCEFMYVANVRSNFANC